MKRKTVVIAAVLFMMISGIRAEHQQTSAEGLADNTERITLSSEADLNQHPNNENTLNTDETSTIKEKQELPQQQYLDKNPRESRLQYSNEKTEEEQYLDEKQDTQHQHLDENKEEQKEKLEEENQEEENLEEKNQEEENLEEKNQEEENLEEKNQEEENQEEEENEGKDNEGEENEEGQEEVEDYAEGYEKKREALEMERLSHQAELFSALNLDQYGHRFEDWGVSMDEEFEDMIRVLGEDDNLPLRDLPIPGPPPNTSDQHGHSRRGFNEDNFFEYPSDKYNDQSERDEKT